MVNFIQVKGDKNLNIDIIKEQSHYFKYVSCENSFIFERTKA